MYIYEGIYYKELALIVMKAGKSQTLRLAYLRSGRTGSVVQSKSGGLRPRRADGINSSMRAEDLCPNLSNQVESHLFSLVFVPIQLFN